jgi:hypothetical protein
VKYVPSFDVPLTSYNICFQLPRRASNARFVLDERAGLLFDMRKRTLINSSTCAFDKAGRFGSLFVPANAQLRRNVRVRCNEELRPPSIASYGLPTRAAYEMKRIARSATFIVPADAQGGEIKPKALDWRERTLPVRGPGWCKVRTDPLLARYGASDASYSNCDFRSDRQSRV